MNVREDAASVATEMVLLTPVLLVLLGFVVFAGRVGGIQQQVIAAVDQAARAASLVATPEAAQQSAARTVEANLGDAGFACRELVVQVDTTTFGRGGHVSVTATCGIGLDDVVFAGLPGRRSFTATATEIIDRHRSER